jgi:excisionase family DNA binding protein
MTQDLAPGTNSAEATPPICVRVDGAMRLLGIGKTKLYDLIATGELETIHIGRRTLVLRTSIDVLVERRRSAAR